MQPPPQQAPSPIQHPVNQPPALPPGTILLDRYLIQGYISGGGFGHIYKAQDNALGYRRAIKEAFSQDTYTRRQFQLEAEFLLNTRHPNLVSAYAVFEQMGRLYLVMDYVSGRTLEEIAIDHIRRTGRTLPEAYVLDVVAPICGALHALHSAPVPVIHRDVKPANIKMTTQGAPILIDLGLAKLYAPGTQTIGAALAFTPGYAPPEQYRAAGATDARTDIYGMGATLFYLLTGYQPTEAPARLGAQAVPAIRQLNPAVSERTEQMVIQAMELEPQRRQQSATELERDLRAARAALGAAGATQPTAAATIVFGASPHETALVCQHCGGSNPPVARHCMRCGWRLVEDAQASAMALGGIEALPAESNEANEANDANAPLPGWLAATLQSAQAEQPAAPAMELGMAPAQSVMPAEASAMAQRAASDAQWVASAAADAKRAPIEEDAAGEGDGTGAAARAPVPAAQEHPAARPRQWVAVAPTAMWLTGTDAPHIPTPADGPGQEAPRVSAAARPRTMAVWKGRRLALPPAMRRQWQHVAAFVATISQPLQHLLPTPRRWQAETLSAAPPLNEDEVRLGLAAVMAVVLGITTLAAVQFSWALLAAVPALALGHWCLRDLRARPLPEARWMALMGVIITYSWLGLYALGALISALHH